MRRTWEEFTSKTKQMFCSLRMPWVGSLTLVTIGRDGFVACPNDFKKKCLPRCPFSPRFWKNSCTSVFQLRLLQPKHQDTKDATKQTAFCMVFASHVWLEVTTWIAMIHTTVSKNLDTMREPERGKRHHPTPHPYYNTYLSSDMEMSNVLKYQIHINIHTCPDRNAVSCGSAGWSGAFWQWLLCGESSHKSWSSSSGLASGSQRCHHFALLVEKLLQQTGNTRKQRMIFRETCWSMVFVWWVSEYLCVFLFALRIDWGKWCHASCNGKTETVFCLKLIWSDITLQIKILNLNRQNHHLNKCSSHFALYIN